MDKKEVFPDLFFFCRDMEEYLYFSINFSLMKLLFVTGGVLSGIGKGIAAASIGALLSGMGYKVFCQKFD